MSILNLSDSSTRPKSNASKSDADIQDEIEHYGLEDIDSDCSTFKEGELDENNTVDNSKSLEENECHYTNMVMNINTGKITNNDIEMVIRAWTSRKRQYYSNNPKYNFTISDVIGR